MPKIFLDTNLLVYTVDMHEKSKQLSARKVLKAVVENDVPVISTQVLQEFYSAATTKLKLDKIAAKNIMHNFHHMEIVQVDLELIEQGIDISIISQISFWHAVIVAAAEKAHDEQSFLEKSKELLRVQRDIHDTGAKVKEKYAKNKKDTEAAPRQMSHHID